MLNEDYKDMLLALSEEKVRYLLVGAYAMAAHGYPRATMDIDIWILPMQRHWNPSKTPNQTVERTGVYSADAP